MKLKRDEFKAMLKECILELVQEGKIFQGSGPTSLHEGSRFKGNPESHEEVTGFSPNSKLNESVRIATMAITKGDPKKVAMYQSIIEDTSRTTLQKQIAGEMTGGALAMESSNPETQQFDQAQIGAFAAKDRWAQLAFGSKVKTTPTR